MRKLAAVLVIACLVMNTAGCAPEWRQKFIRKKKEVKKMPKIYQERKYIKKPTPELYKKHYSYWVTWQSELLKVLGQNHKKDVRCINEIIANLKDMQGMLVQEKADRLQKRIDSLSRVRDTIVREDLSQFNKTYVRTTLEREDRAIKREFTYDKIKKYLRLSFEGEEVEEIAEEGNAPPSSQAAPESLTSVEEKAEGAKEVKDEPKEAVSK